MTHDDAVAPANLSGPAAQTSGPAAQTSGPAAQTSSPAAQTSSPATQTSGPAAQTSSPATQTSSPAEGVGWFEGVVRAHSRALVRYFARRAPYDDAEDLAAEVLLIAWRRRADVPPEAELPWLYRTAGYVLANYRRKRTELLLEELPDRPTAPRVGTDPEVSALFDAELRGALATLSPRDREIILLHAWEGLDGTQLAAVLGISRSGADAALSRARKRLREAWGDRLDL